MGMSLPKSLWRGPKVPGWLEAFAATIDDAQVQIRKPSDSAAIDTAEVKGTLGGRLLLLYVIYSSFEMPTEGQGAKHAHYEVRYELQLGSPAALERLVIKRTSFFGRLFVGANRVESGNRELDRKLLFKAKSPVGLTADARDKVQMACLNAELVTALLDLVVTLGFETITLEDDTVKLWKWMSFGPGQLHPDQLERIYRHLATVCDSFQAKEASA